MEQRSSLPGGNCKKKWHGTTRLCTLGDDDAKNDFCGKPQCSLCSILMVAALLACQRVVTDVLGLDIVYDEESRKIGWLQPLWSRDLHD